jgi:dihydroorotase
MGAILLVHIERHHAVVDKFDRERGVLLCQHNILRLDVVVHTTDGVKVLQTKDEMHANLANSFKREGLA